MDSLPEDYFVTSYSFTKRTHRDVYPAIDPTSASLSLAGKVAIVTGASKGIGGKGIAPAVAKSGPKALILVATSAKSLASTKEELKKTAPNVPILSVPTDLSNAASVTHLFEKVTAEFGQSDVLIHAASLNGSPATMIDASPDTWWRDFEVNGLGTFNIAQAFLKQLPTSAHGTVVNLNTPAAYSTFPQMSAYGISKLVGLQVTAYIASEHSNVTAIALSPGVVATGMVLDEFRKFAKDTPALVGGEAVWLCSEKAQWLSGRYVSANWDVEDLCGRKEEVLTRDLLRIDLKGEFGQK